MTGCSWECCFRVVYVEWYGVCDCRVFSGRLWGCVCVSCLFLFVYGLWYFLLMSVLLNVVCYLRQGIVI